MKDVTTRASSIPKRLSNDRGALLMQFLILAGVLLGIIVVLRQVYLPAIKDNDCFTALQNVATSSGLTRTYGPDGFIDDTVNVDNLSALETNADPLFKSFIPGGTVKAGAISCENGVATNFGTVPGGAPSCPVGGTETILVFSSPDCPGSANIGVARIQPGVNSYSAAQVLGGPPTVPPSETPCFAGQTFVLTVNASGELESRSIEDIKAGDLVLSAPDGMAESILSKVSLTSKYIELGEIHPARVMRTMKHPDRTVYLVLLEDGSRLRTTSEHPFYVEGEGWLSARDLKPGARLQDSTGGFHTVSSSMETEEKTTVYNFSVEGTRTYFVIPEGASYGVWVHNKVMNEPI